MEFFVFEAFYNSFASYPFFFLLTIYLIPFLIFLKIWSVSFLSKGEHLTVRMLCLKLVLMHLDLNHGLLYFLSLLCWRYKWSNKDKRGMHLRGVLIG